MLYEDVSNELRSFNDNDYYGYIKLNAKSLYEIMPLADLTKSQALKNLFLEQWEKYLEKKILNRVMQKNI